MAKRPPCPVFFHTRQLDHKPLYEWRFGERLEHPETTDRAGNILVALQAREEVFPIIEPAPIEEPVLAELFDARLLDIYRAAERLSPEATYYPSVFPRRGEPAPDAGDLRHAGYFCFDSGTPLCHTTWDAARWSAASAVAAAREVRRGAPYAYALCRPPGHHAARDLFGGYCYFNNAALAARELPGRVALVDIDFHHGNGTQEMFYADRRVLFASIHGDPREFYPYFSGFASERGAVEAEGFTLNVPLPGGCDAQGYLEAIDRRIIPEVRAFAPDVLVLSAGFDTYRKDPIGTFTLDTPDYHEIGARFGRLGVPVVVLQEGGYCVEALGRNVATFLHGLRDASGAPG
jgi:acetoin utilization deacetylase AcuC-like enzyme